MDKNVTRAQVTIYGTDQYTCLFPAHAGKKSTKQPTARELKTREKK